MEVSQMEIEEIIGNEHVYSAMKLCSAGLLSYPEGKHQIENCGVDFTPIFSKDELIDYCKEHMPIFKRYNLKYGADYKSGKIKESGVIPLLEDL